MTDKRLAEVAYELDCGQRPHALAKELLTEVRRLRAIVIHQARPKTKKGRRT
jgi:hypothetical protein